MKFFQDVKTTQELKERYLQLAKKYHPDRGGDAETMKAINSEWDDVRKHFERAGKFGKFGVEPGEEKPFDIPEGLREVIERLVVLTGVTIEICGRWIWVRGDTKQHRHTLKQIGCFWSSGKKAWYWRPADCPGIFTRGRMKMDEIRERFGSQKVDTQEAKALE